MSIKNQLRAAILSGGAEGASPSGQTVTMSATPSIQAWGKISEFTSPCNGFVILRGRSTDVKGMASTATNNAGYVGMNWATQGVDFGYSKQVRKGDFVDIQGSYLESITVTVFKLVGGGKTTVAQLIWRVVPCLRSTFDQCLSRTVDRIRACLRKMSLTFIESCRVTEKNMSFIQLRQTVGLCYRLRTVPYLFHYESGALTLRISRLLTRGVQRISRSLKEKKSLSLLTTAQSKQKRFTYTFSNTLARKLCFGGASHA